MKFIIGMFLLCVCLTACGQKGPLYLPQDEKPAPPAAKPAPTPAVKTE